VLTTLAIEGYRSLQPLGEGPLDEPLWKWPSR